jgi:hypothetical protein
MNLTITHSNKANLLVDCDISEGVSACSYGHPDNWTPGELPQVEQINSIAMERNGRHRKLQKALIDELSVSDSFSDRILHEAENER